MLPIRFCIPRKRSARDCLIVDLRPSRASTAQRTSSSSCPPSALKSTSLLENAQAYTGVPSFSDFLTDNFFGGTTPRFWSSMANLASLRKSSIVQPAACNSFPLFTSPNSSSRRIGTGSSSNDGSVNIRVVISITTSSGLEISGRSIFHSFHVMFESFSQYSPSFRIRAGDGLLTPSMCKRVSPLSPIPYRSHSADRDSLLSLPSIPLAIDSVSMMNLGFTPYFQLRIAISNCALCDMTACSCSLSCLSMNSARSSGTQCAFPPLRRTENPKHLNLGSFIYSSVVMQRNEYFAFESKYVS